MRYGISLRVRPNLPSASRFGRFSFLHQAVKIHCPSGTNGGRRAKPNPDRMVNAPTNHQVNLLLRARPNSPQVTFLGAYRICSSYIVGSLCLFPPRTRAQHDAAAGLY